MIKLMMILLVSAFIFSACSSSKNETKKEVSRIITTESGLQYEDLVLGNGVSPEVGKTVVVHYVGTLLDGTVFDSSRERDKKFEFKIGIGQVIKGWDEGVMSMKAGGVRKLIIPANLAYGERATGKIPANSTLVFEVELFDVK